MAEAVHTCDHLVLAACLVAPGPTDEQLLAAAGITGTRLFQPLVAGEVVGALCGRVEDVNLRVWRCGGGVWIKCGAGGGQ